MAEEFERLFVQAVEAIPVGDPLDERTELGPLARADLLEACDQQVRASLNDGARLLTGGHRLDRDGFFYAPTILTDVRPDLPVFRQETFGPVAAITRARDEDHGVEFANDTPFGLGASVWTGDAERGQRVGRRVQSGALFIKPSSRLIRASLSAV